MEVSDILSLVKAGFTKDEIVCAMQENADVQIYTIVNRIFAQDELQQLEETEQKITF